MKKIISLCLICISFSLLLISCLKKDTEAPFIRLNGAPDTAIVLNSKFVDPSAFAKDGMDGTIIPTISTNLNTDSVGVYRVTYIARDLSGNTSSVDRTVRVGNEIDYIAGTYAVSSSICSNSNNVSYTETVLSSNRQNNRIVFVNLGNYPAVYVEADVDANKNLFIPFQGRAYNHPPLKTLNFSGPSNSGKITIETIPAPQTKIEINYNVQEVDTSNLMNQYSCNIIFIKQ